MVFSSVPAYLDPSNWQQQPNNHFLPPPQASAAPPPPPPPLPHGGGGVGAPSVRPGSMSERARLANMPMPENSLKCPRCESTNTKFCYFNNYSLSQPRHFCKTCRRYWTRGGALRSVPVGGGCRRNKRSKSSASKSSPASQTTTSATSTTTVSTNSAATATLLGLNPPFPPLRFVSPLSQLSDNYTAELGLNYSGIADGTSEMSFHGGSNLLGGIGGGIEPWRLQQFPFFGGLDPSPPGVYQFQGGEPGLLGTEPSQLVRPKLSSSLLTQFASVKMEDNPDLNLSRQLLGGIGGNEHWNSTTNWSEFSSFSSSSTSNQLQ